MSSWSYFLFSQEQTRPSQRHPSERARHVAAQSLAVSAALHTLLDVRKPKFIAETGDWWFHLTWRQIFGYFCAVAGIALTIQTVRVSPENQLMIAVVAAFAQLMAATMFSRQGKADPAHAKRSVERLIALARKVSGLETAAQKSFEGSHTPTERREHMGQVSAQLGSIGEEVASAVFDWTVFNEHLTVLLSDKERESAERHAAALRAADNSSKKGQG